MDSWAFEQLNRLLTPEQSPQNGPGSDADRNSSTLSFPVSGDALQAQLEAWTNVAFNFEAPELHDDPSKGVSASSLGPSFGIDNYDLGFHQSLGLHPPAVDDPLLLQGTHHIRDDPYGSDLYAPLPASLVLPSPSTSSLSPPSVPALPQLSTQPGAAATSSKASAAAGGRASASKKRRQSTSVGSGSPEEQNPETPAAALNDDDANSIAVEEDKRRRNTAASARFRIKKKQREAALESTAKELRDRVTALEREVDVLRTENGWLRGLIVGKEEQERKTLRDEAANAVPTA